MTYEKRKIGSYELILYAMVFVSSLVVLQFSGRTWFLYIQVFFCLFLVIREKKVILLPYKTLNLIFLLIFICTFSAIVSNMPYSYKKAAVISAIYMIPMYFSASYCYGLLKEKRNILVTVVRAFKAMALLQLLWIPLQYIFYHLAGIDINKLIFVDTLHLLENASFIRSWVYYPSGLSWHSAVLAPLMVIAFCLFRELPIRALIIIDSLICGNSTAAIGVAVCIILSVGYSLLRLLKKHKNKVKKNSLIYGSIFLIILIFLFYRFSLVSVLSNQFFYISSRLFGGESDASTSAHLQYYSDYITVVKNSSFLQILFGYGLGCSGYTITQMYNRYVSLGNWAIECDIINIAINRGVIGFFVYYSFLFYIAIKGRKLDKRYFIVMVSILIQGFGYNVQWDYLFFLEMIFYFSIKFEINFFECDTKSNKSYQHNRLKLFMRRFQ